MIVEQVPKADLRQCSDVRGIVDDYVETAGRALARNSIQQSQVRLIALVGDNPSGGVVYGSRVQIQANDLTVSKEVSPLQ